MSLNLPPPIAAYFASENIHDVSAIDGCFAADGVVRDEKRTIEGIAAIKAWRAEAAAKYAHTVEPLAVSHRHGKVIVTGKVSGTFPGSPINLDHIFEIRGHKIASLEIR